MDATEQAVAKKVGDDFIAALPVLLADEAAKLPAAVQPYATPIIALVLPAILPTIQAWFDKLVA